MVSIVLPVFNEQDNLKSLWEELDLILRSLPQENEVIFINDGSEDDSGKVLDSIALFHPFVKVIHLSRNFGQSAALAAGIEAARGDILITLDADGQNDPADLPSLLQKLDQGFDVVSGWRKNRQDPLWSRVLPSVLANRMISWITGVHLHDYGCTLKAYRKEVLKHFPILGEMHRLLPAYCAWQGARVAEIEVHHRPRRAGISKYGLGKIFKVILDVLVAKFFFSYLTRPVYLFGGTGIGFLGLGISVGLFVIYRQFYLGGIWISPLLFVSIFFFGMGTICLLMGMLAEMVARTYFKLHAMKPYVIKGEKVRSG